MLLFSRFQVTGHSMEPVAKPGDKVVISSLPYFFSKPKLGDLVAVNHPQKKGKILLKKIERVENNKTFYVAGINKNDSEDSRKFGPVERNQILGKVVFKY